MSQKDPRAPSSDGRKRTDRLLKIIMIQVGSRLDTLDSKKKVLTMMKITDMLDSDMEEDQRHGGENIGIDIVMFPPRKSCTI